MDGIADVRRSQVSAPPGRAERLLYAVFAITVAGAYAPGLIEQPQAFAHPQGIALLALGALFLLVGTYGHWYCQRLGSRAALVAYFSAQLGLAAAIGFLSAGSGTYWLVMFPLLAQAAINLPRAGAVAVTAGVWGVFTAVGSVNFGLAAGLMASFSFLAAMAFVVGVSYLLVQERRSRAEVERLAAELGEANRRLEAYAAEADELAAARERNRLARELHDSATQTIFSITLTAEAARMLLERNPQRVPAQLQRLQDLSHGALAEMRALVQHLRLAGRDEGLLPALRQHLEALRSREGLAVDFKAEGGLDLSEDQTEGVFRIVQEALNNVLKHARTDRAEVTLRAEDGSLSVTVQDRGAGFDPALAAGKDGHFGMAGMRERAQLLGAAFSVTSAPGQGTRVSIQLPAARME